jgi:hypothetical protein
LVEVVEEVEESLEAVEVEVKFINPHGSQLEQKVE